MLSVSVVFKNPSSVCYHMVQPKSKVVVSKDPNVVSSQEEEEDVAKGTVPLVRTEHVA